MSYMLSAMDQSVHAYYVTDKQLLELVWLCKTRVCKQGMLSRGGRIEDYS